MDHLRNTANASLNASLASFSYLISYRLTKVRVAVPVKIVRTQNELKAEVGFLARNEKMYARGRAPNMNKLTRAMRATGLGGTC